MSTARQALPTWEQALAALGQAALSPLSLKFRNLTGSRSCADIVLDVSWRDRTHTFEVEYTSYATPRLLRQATIEIADRAQREERHPLIIAPYLPEEQLRYLEERGVSGLDLSGNGVITIPGELLVFRTGAPNRYPASAPIRNIFAGTTSLVPRVLLLRPEYESVSEVQAEIERRGSRIALSTVSKALKSLDEELIVSRERGGVRLLQPEKLLERLTGAFRPLNVRRRAAGKATVASEDLPRTLAVRAAETGIRLVATGAASTGLYATMARGNTLAVYCSDLCGLLEGLPFTETSRFPDLEVLETDEETAYFDARQEDGFPWASPLQTYLELTAGDKRDQETAEQVRATLLAGLDRSLRG